jgi:hypothetical protein
VRQPTQLSFGAARASPMSRGKFEIVNVLVKPVGRGLRDRRRRMDPVGLASPLIPMVPPLRLGRLTGNPPGAPINDARQLSSVSSALVGKLFYPLKFTFWMPG